MKVSGAHGFQNLYPITKFDTISPSVNKIKEYFQDHHMVTEYKIKCSTGFGHTIGNSIRRTCLSSVEGSAIIGFRLEGALHIFGAVVGIKEIVQDISINLKQINFKLRDGLEYGTMVLNKKNNEQISKKIYASDFSNQESIEIINKDQFICTLDAGKEINLEILIGTGIGYLVSDKHKFNFETKEIIPLDSIFSPIVRCAYDVLCFTGGKEEYDEISLTIVTNGSKTGDEVLNDVIILLKKNFQSILGEEAIPDVQTKQQEQPQLTTQQQLLNEFKNHLLQDSDLSMRVKNKLLNGEHPIRTVAELANMSEYQLRALGGLGDVCISDIKRFLSERGLCFKVSNDRGMK